MRATREKEVGIKVEKKRQNESEKQQYSNIYNIQKLPFDRCTSTYLYLYDIHSRCSAKRKRTYHERMRVGGGVQ